MRLIDADVAIEELTDRSHQAAKRVGTDSPFWEGLVIARRIVNNLPTIQPETPCYLGSPCEYQNPDVVISQPEPQWIMCSERMPEKTPLWKTVGYLATVTCDSWKESRTMYVKWETTTVRGKEVSRWTFDNRLFPSEWKVVAWMPLPEPYKGVQNGRSN